MKLKTATLMAIIGTAVGFAWSIISFLMVMREHFPSLYLLSIRPSLFLEGCLLFFLLCFTATSEQFVGNRHD